MVDLDTNQEPQERQMQTYDYVAFAPDETVTLRRPTARPGAFYDVAEMVGRCAHCLGTINRYIDNQWRHVDGPRCDARVVAELDEDRVRETLRSLRVEDMRQAQQIAQALMNEDFGPVDAAHRAAARLASRAHSAA